MKRSTTTALIAAGLLISTAGTAAAGETNGRGDPIPGARNASSACAFSGRDLPDDVEDNPLPEFDDDAVTGGTVQSYGKYVAAGLKAFAPRPADECRGNLHHED